MAFESKNETVVETVIFNGRRYNRYPNSGNPAHRRYFARSGSRLHRDVWEFHNGKIQKGFQIHHIDGDTSNNDISNLECLSFQSHRAEHHSGYVARGKSEQQLTHLAKIQELAKDWHRSEEGREWHRKHASTSFRAPEAPKPYSKSHYTGVCEWCGTGFEARSPKKLMCSTPCVEGKSRYLCGRSRQVHPHYAASLQPDS